MPSSFISNTRTQTQGPSARTADMNPMAPTKLNITRCQQSRKPLPGAAFAPVALLETLFASLLATLLASMAWAQPPQSPILQGPVIREVEDLGPVIVPDDGDGVVLYGTTLESILQSIRQKTNQAPPPSYRVERVEISGVAPGPSTKRGTLPLTVKVQLRITDDSGVVRAPIGFRRLALRSPAGSPKYQGKGEARLEYSERDRQFVCVVKGEADSFHEIEFEMACAVLPDRLGQQISLSLPVAPTIFVVTIPSSPVEGSVSKGNYLLSPPKTQGRQTEFTLEGQGDELQFTWRPGARPIVNTRPSLTAQTEIDIHVQGKPMCEPTVRC